MRLRLAPPSISQKMSLDSTDAGADSKNGMRYVTDDGKPIIQVAFFSPNGSDDGQCVWMNSMAACWTGDGINNFSHCEIRFSNNKACSVTEETTDKDTGDKYGGFVHYTQRSLSRDGYEFIEFAVSPKQESIMRKMAKDCAKARVPFNKAGMLLNFVAPVKWWPIDREGRAFFCSELITVMLQRAGYLKDIKPCTTSPTALWHALRSLEDVCDGYNWGHKQVTSDMLVSPIKMTSAPKKKKKRGGEGGFTLAPRQPKKRE